MTKGRSMTLIALAVAIAVLVVWFGGGAAWRWLLAMHGIH